MPEDFGLWQVRNSQRRTRPLLILALSLILIFVAGAWLMGELALPTAVFLLVVLLPTLAATLLLAASPARHGPYQLMLSLSAFWTGLICVSVVLRASLAGMSHYLALQTGLILLIWLALGLRFRHAAVPAVALSLIYIGGMLWWDFAGDMVLFAAALLAAVNLIGGYACFALEEAHREALRDAQVLGDLAERDSLTGLFNRRSYDHYLSRLWRQSQREQAQLAILLVDVDCFKEFNDLYGHQAGDEVLKKVAGTIARIAQRPLDFAARYGGDEFSLVLYGSAGGALRELPEELRTGIENLAIPHAGSPAASCVTVSIGVAVLLPGSQRSLAGAIQLADEALYQAKEEGRNRVVVKESRFAHIETGRFRAGRKRSARA